MARIMAVVAFVAMAALLVAGEPPATIYSCVGSSQNCQNATTFLQNAHSSRMVAALNGAYATAAARNGSYSELVASAGRFTYDVNSATSTNETSFDMASCSKIMGATTAIAQLYQAGNIALDEIVATERLLGTNFAAQGKGSITIRNLLLHNAGFPPDPNPGYSSPIFGCPQTKFYHPGQDFTCDDKIFNNLVHNQTLVYPTGSQFIYSDLSFITAMFVVGRVVQRDGLVADADYPPVCFDQKHNKVCSFYAYVDKFVFKRYGLNSTSYIPTSPLNTPPAWESVGYHHGLVMGYVSDQNAYALGGISGHAGVFSTVGDALKFMKVWMNVEDPAMLNATTVALFTKVANLTQSSRALGWDTNDQPAPACGNLSKKTFFHIGYTGTQFCGDPENGIMTVLLGNGRYPNYTVDNTIILRPEYNTLVLSLLGPATTH
jgi:CubicO group peptidase (beta-lactamase class C family)